MYNNYCEFCGMKVFENERKCSCCGARIKFSNTYTADNSINIDNANNDIDINQQTKEQFQPQKQIDVEQTVVGNQKENDKYKLNFFIQILTLIFPIPMLIIALITIGNNPKKSKSIIKLAIIFFVIEVIFGLYK